ncbi:hypothetical protein [Candidatus Regiella endosymbiont of Tuberolachnus salignus]|uniref:hypothetical protein n=1 Tax=Candidatus Regiella endosymbiont of Tuberolachnus salignus TaxID=3077956 RepID=UPI0030CF861C
MILEVNTRIYLFLKKNTAIPHEIIEKIETKPFIVELDKYETLKQENDSVTKLVEELTRIRKDSFYDNLHQSGYEATIIEKIADFLKHLIPFYDAIKNLQDGKKLEAAGYFVLDLLMFLPLIGEVGKLSVGMSEVLISAANISRLRMTRYLATGSLKFAIKNTAPCFFKEGIFGTSNLLTKQTLIYVLKATVRSVDPGFELVYMGGKYIYKQSNQLTNKILKELNTYNDYSLAYKDMLINMLSKPRVEIPLQKKYITNEMLSTAIQLAQQNRYERIIEELTSLKNIMPKVPEVQTYPLTTTCIASVCTASLREVNLSFENIRTVTSEMIDGVSHLNISSNPINSLPPTLPNTLTYLNLSNTRILSLPKLPDTLTYLNISHTLMRVLPEDLPSDLQELNISKTRIDMLVAVCPKQLKIFNIFDTPVSMANKLPDSYLHSNCRVINELGSEVIRQVQARHEHLSRQQITERTIKQWIEKEGIEFKIT